MPDSRDFFTAVAIAVLVGLLPWLGSLWPKVSMFGFPWFAFVPLLAVPLVLIILVRSAPDEDLEPDQGDL